jgi:hypothetical protein
VRVVEGGEEREAGLAESAEGQQSHAPMARKSVAAAGVLTLVSMTPSTEIPWTACEAVM